MSQRMIRNQSVHEKMEVLQKQVDALTSELVQLWGYNPDDQELELVSECLRHKLHKFVRNTHTCCKRSCCMHKKIDHDKCDCEKYIERLKAAHIKERELMDHIVMLKKRIYGDDYYDFPNMERLGLKPSKVKQEEQK